MDNFSKLKDYQKFDTSLTKHQEKVKSTLRCFELTRWLLKPFDHSFIELICFEAAIRIGLVSSLCYMKIY